MLLERLHELTFASLRHRQTRGEVQELDVVGITQHLGDVAAVDDLAAHVEPLRRAVAGDEHQRRFRAVEQLLAPAFEAGRVVEVAMPHRDVFQASEVFLEHAAEGVFAVGEAMLPMRFQDDEPSEVRLGFHALAEPNALERHLVGMPFAVKALPVFIEREPAFAGRARFLIAEDEAVALQPAFERRLPRALVEPEDAVGLLDEPHPAIAGIPNAFKAARAFPGSPTRRPLHAPGAEKLAVAAELEPALAFVIRFVIGEVEPLIFERAFQRAVPATISVFAMHLVAVLREGERAKSGKPTAIEVCHCACLHFER